MKRNLINKPDHKQLMDLDLHCILLDIDKYNLVQHFYKPHFYHKDCPVHYTHQYLKNEDLKNQHKIVKKKDFS